jgi:phosphoglucosamine mutase
LRTAVGDRYVVEAMREHSYLLGGEQSGHLVFLEQSTTGDGVLAALQVLAVMIEEGRPLSELGTTMTRYPQVLLNFDVGEKRPLEGLDSVQKAIKSAEASMGSEGRVLVRYSGTERKARVMVEGQDEGSIRAHAETIAQALKRALAT